jgi:hypothetical protein
MRSKAQIEQSRINGRKSRGPTSEEGKAVSCLNSLMHGLCAATEVLPWESQDEFEAFLRRWVRGLKPETEEEVELTRDSAFARWALMRAQRALFEYAKSYIDSTAARAQEEALELMTRLFWDPCGPTSVYGLSTAACGGPQTSSSTGPDDVNQPARVLTQLESCTEGCRALLENWRMLMERVQNDLPWQAPDRLKAIRMVGKQPVDAAVDETVNMILVATFSLHPKGRNDPYHDLKTDLTTPELDAFRERAQTRWPVVLPPIDKAIVKQSLIDFVSRRIDRLEAKLEVHVEYDKERDAKNKGLLPSDIKTPEGEKLAKYEAAWQRRAQRCDDAYWKHRKMKEQFGDGGGGFSEVNEVGLGAGTGGEVAGASDPEVKSPSEPKTALKASDIGTVKEVAAIAAGINEAMKALAMLRAAGIQPRGAWLGESELGMPGDLGPMERME